MGIIEESAGGRFSEKEKKNWVQKDKFFGRIKLTNFVNVNDEMDESANCWAYLIIF